MDAESVVKLVQDGGGSVDNVVVFDDHAFLTASFPLPKDHWIYQEPNVPPMPMRMGCENPGRQEMTGKIVAAARYAVRGATDSGRIDDFDPDALVQNMVIGLLGYWTPDGLSVVDLRANPDPVPVEVRGLVCDEPVKPPDAIQLAIQMADVLALGDDDRRTIADIVEVALGMKVGPVGGVDRELQAYRDFVGKLGEWTHAFGAELCPGRYADTFGEGKRCAKAEVADMLKALAAGARNGWNEVKP